MDKIKTILLLAKKPVRTCRYLHTCFLCEKDIVDGQKYIDGGYGKRCHFICYKEYNQISDNKKGKNDDKL